MKTDIKHISIVFLISIITISLSGIPGTYSNYAGPSDSVNDSSICLQVSNEFVRVDFINPSVFRIRINNKEEFPDGGMVRYGIVDTRCQHHKIKRNNKGNNIEFSTDNARIVLNKKDGKIQLFGADGRLLIQNDQSPKSCSEQGFDLSFGLTPDERLYGLGDETRDRIQKRGHKNRMVVMNVESYVPIPFIMSDHGWGVFLNTTMYHSFDAGATVNDRLSFKAEHGIIDYFIIAGNSMPDILDKYTNITGKPILLPKWGYGLTFICDERQLRARDMLYEAYEFRRQGIPCDVIGLEPDWMEKHYDFSLDKQWSKERFDIPFWLKGKDYGTFDAALKNMNFKLSLWLCCDYDLSEWEEMQLNNGKAGINNTIESRSLEEDLFHDPHFAPVYFDKLHKPGVPWFEHLKKFVDDGASAFKLDGSNQINFHPDRKWKNGMEDYEMHNLYPVIYNKQMSLGFREYTGRRSMIYSSGGYAGIQRYSATWAGDTGGDKGTLISLLNHGLSGHSNVCTDMETSTKSGIHYGFFQTISEVLGWQMYVEPWFLGEEKAAMFKDYANLRYKLIPYIYTMAHIASEKAMPVMRAMPLMYPSDPKCDKFEHQYMFGDAFLVSAFDSTVYLPEGEWIDYWTGKKMKGNQEISAEYPENKGGPLFVKAGAIIPTQAVKGSIGTQTPENIMWEIFPKGESAFTLIEDDGESYRYLEGKIAKTLLECRESSNDIRIIIHPRVGLYDKMPQKRTHSINIFYEGKLIPENKNITYSFDKATNILTINDIPETNEEINIVLSKQ
ncbi:MAG TPA: glycoside hydrolase family 31 protein [Bacteroidales bacterium]|nr:glycoside hydrolase family 31 protein [Bacteroidales bacterium]HPT20374.1 glycoside hydrolase family 31 protein [Bacteroidales bacterium]